MSDEQLELIYDKLNNIDHSLAEGLLAAKDKYQYLRDIEPSLEGNSDYTDVYANLEDFIGDRSTRLAKFYTELKGKTPSFARLNSFIDKNSDISKEDVLKWFKKTNEYKEYYKQQRAKEAGKTRRKMEIDKEWKQGLGWLNNLLSSDYEKQRYIEDPQSAIFGKEAPGFFGSSAGAKADLISGLGAGAVDIATSPLPIVNSIAGPTIRAGRDIAHVASDSPYKKDMTTIAKDFGTDVVFNAGTSVLANARRGARIASNLVEPEVKASYELAHTTDDIIKGLKELPTPSNSQEFAYAIRKLPESPLKQDLLNTIGKNNQFVDVNAANNIIHNYNKETRMVWKNANELQLEGINTTLPPRSPYLSEILTTPRPKGPIQWTEYGGLRFIDLLNKGKVGTVGFETGRTALGRGSKPEYKPSIEDYEAKKNQYRQSEARYWSAGFRPNKMDGDPLWEAYKEWYQDTYGKDVEDK